MLNAAFYRGCEKSNPIFKIENMGRPSGYELRDVFHMTLTTHQRESS